ncbi:hypothetical protein Q8W37_14780 [Shimia thalassica]|jgi:hypothetical protein|uniref:Uncharacterized protein n=1 Tax=Shimia thalassica TaxID=1715693 RepID=A0A0P1IWE5_9RHOB|nr:hypothetical protein [Shimia thalassica]MBU2942337.1 hypothetical protein [Shimia thalassica]MDO6479791.1 hypothetical protein [Shimia thalassica]MDO6504265.1 hypothetical protein [Shimia thalassica]MDP2495627.1 hypothetical protein [Shimia thalassica]MDP2581202.1 hypothetical protein [Shimia thalassica]
MELIADALLIAGAIGAGVYCLVLGRRLARFNNLETGVGGAVAVLSAQVDDLTKALESGQQAANLSAEKLSDLTQRADASAKKLELLVASMHDLPQQKEQAVELDPRQEAVFVRHFAPEVGAGE